MRSHREVCPGQDRPRHRRGDGDGAAVRRARHRREAPPPSSCGTSTRRPSAPPSPSCPTGTTRCSRLRRRRRDLDLDAVDAPPRSSPRSGRSTSWSTTPGSCAATSTSGSPTRPATPSSPSTSTPSRRCMSRASSSPEMIAAQRRVPPAQPRLGRRLHAQPADGRVCRVEVGRHRLVRLGAPGAQAGRRRPRQGDDGLPLLRQHRHVRRRQVRAAAADPRPGRRRRRGVEGMLAGGRSSCCPRP
jgi:hypothetical protein